MREALEGHAISIENVARDRFPQWQDRSQGSLRVLEALLEQSGTNAPANLSKGRKEVKTDYRNCVRISPTSCILPRVLQPS